jgi:hypothetical protein
LAWPWCFSSHRLGAEVRQKNAGLRTHTLVGVGAALFMLISKYGFTDVLEPRLVVLDPSRVAAQIVTGVGFLGAGLIFVRRDSVRGLTTATAIWVTAAVGAAAGTGLPLLAVLTTGIYFLVAVAFPVATRWLPRSSTAISALRVRYPTAGASCATCFGRQPTGALLLTMSPPRRLATGGHPVRGDHAPSGAWWNSPFMSTVRTPSTNWPPYSPSRRTWTQF